MSTAPIRKKWTREECEVLQSSGLWDGKHYELIEGELIDKMGKKWPHVSALIMVRDWLVLKFGGAFVAPEPSIDVSPEDNPTSDPEPDVVVLNKPYSEFSANPTPAEVRLIVEVSDTTVRYDSTIKAGLYARAGIAEYWVLDVIKRKLIVHRNPANGSYQSVNAYGAAEIVASGAIPQPFEASAVFHH